VFINSKNNGHLQTKYFIKFAGKYIYMTGLNYIPLLVEKLIATKPEKIILFGSYAYGEPTNNSDLDILVVTGDQIIPASFAEKSKIYLKISQAISDIKKEFPVDLIVHTKAMHQQFIKENSLFARELLIKGKVLYEKNN
jgi:predicted nucleotidyltransferase